MAEKITMPDWLRTQYASMPDDFKMGVFVDYVHLVRDIIGSDYVLQHYENEAGPLAAAALAIAQEWQKRDAPEPAPDLCTYLTLGMPRLRCTQPATTHLDHAYGAHAHLCEIHTAEALATGEWTESQED